MNTCQRLPLAGPYQQNPKNNMNQTFDCINPDLNPQEPPNLNSNTSPVSDPLLFGFFLFQYFGRNFQVKSSCRQIHDEVFLLCLKFSECTFG
jgi:hypothetical protein